MKETRKQLIKILEPYMEKNLQKGCLVELWEGEIIEINRIYKDDFNEINYFFHHSDGAYSYSNLKKEEYEDLKILGHYDLSAVLKYIISAKNINGLIIEQYPSINKEEIIFEYRGSGIARFLKIPNKSLHLYTQEEEINLLKLLKDLGKQ